MQIKKYHTYKIIVILQENNRDAIHLQQISQHVKFTDGYHSKICFDHRFALVMIITSQEKKSIKKRLTHKLEDQVMHTIRDCSKWQANNMLQFLAENIVPLQKVRITTNFRNHRLSDDFDNKNTAMKMKNINLDN